MSGFKLNLARGDVDVPFLVTALLDFDVVAHRAEDVFEDSESQIWWQTQETGFRVDSRNRPVDVSMVSWWNMTLIAYFLKFVPSIVRSLAKA
jgi:hypothetical protein